MARCESSTGSREGLVEGRELLSNLVEALRNMTRGILNLVEALRMFCWQVCTDHVLREVPGKLEQGRREQVHNARVSVKTHLKERASSKGPTPVRDRPAAAQRVVGRRRNK